MQLMFFPFVYIALPPFELIFETIKSAFISLKIVF